MRAVCLTTSQRTRLSNAVVVTLWLAFAASPVAWSQAPPKNQGQAKAPLTTLAPPVAAEARQGRPLLSANEVNALRDVVYHERRAVILLERATQYLKDNQLSQAFDALQTLLGDPQELLAPSNVWTYAPSDSFFLADSQLHSVRHETLLVFESLTNDQLRFYEKKYSEAANSALQAARESGSSAAWLEVARRCFPTLAGAQATDEAATRLLDRGEAAMAAKLWLRIVRSRVHRNRLHPRLFEKAATALFLAGDEQQAQQVIAEAEGIFGSVPFSAATIETVAKNYPHFGSMAMVTAENDPFGSPSNNGLSRGSVPYLAPVWTSPLYGNQPYDKLANWEVDRTYDELAETGVAVFPIIAQEKLIVRDLQGIRGCDPETGRILWRFNATLSVPGFVNELRLTDPGRSVSLIETAWVENSAQGIITSDDRRVFAIDWLKFRAQDLPGGVQSIQASNRLVCLEIPSQPISEQHLGDSNNDETTVVEPLWSVGGSADDGVLVDQIFLGAPRPVDDALFVITESRRDRELNLVKLEAATGRVVWVQKIGLVQQSGINATERARTLPMALPAFSDGLVICQPDAEIIVAVDASQGELKWIYTYGRDGLMGGRSRRSFNVSGGGFRGLPSTPLIHRQSVFCLPQHSEEIHRLDLSTGRRIWKVDRQDDAYLAAVTDRIVACVGKNGVRGLSLVDGSVVWSARIGLPSGHGVRLDHSYIVPLKSGGIASVDLDTGRWTISSIVPERSRQRYARSRQINNGKLIGIREHNLSLFGLDDERIPNEFRPGNLLFHNGLVFSVGPQHVTAFPEARTMLDGLLQKARQNQPVDELLVAQLEVSSNQEEAAAARLTRLIATKESAEQPAESLSDTVDHAKWLLRELMIRQLNDDKSGLSVEQKSRMIEQLAELSRQPEEREYALIEQSHWQAENVSTVSAVDLARQAIDAGLSSFIPMKGNADCLVTADAYARDLVRQSIQTSSLADRARLQDLIETDLQVALSLDTIDSLKSFLRLYSATDEAGRVRNRLADRFAQKGQFQEAELLILQNRSHPDTNVRAVAEALLISLWSETRLSVEAGNALYRFQSEFASADLTAVTEDRLETILAALAAQDVASERPQQANDGGTLTGTAFVRLFSGNEAARQVFADLHPLAWPVQHVTIKQQTLGASNPLTSDLWTGSSSRVIYGQHSEFDIVRDSNGFRSKWRILDRLAGTERGQITMPGRVTMPGSEGYRAVGHLMPVGTGAAMLSVSLLEHQDERPFWELHFPPLESGQELIEPGPATPSVCVFQTRKHLFGIEPASGRVLWRRSDLDLASGVHVDREAGLFGDEQVLVMFHADQKSYTLFSTQTGEVIRKDKANVDFRYPHHVVGRKLFHVTLETGSSRKRIRIWDPLTDTMELDEELVDRFNSAWSTEGELALMTTNTRLRVFSKGASRMIVDLKLEQPESNYMPSLRVFSDDQNVYINLQQSDVTGNSNRIYSLASDSVVPVNHVHRGLLIAVSRESGKLLWKIPVQQRSFIRTDQCSLPFLVGLSRVSPQRTSSLRSLEVRVIDCMTGEDFVEPTPMIQDRIIHYQIDRDSGELQLHGLNSRIDIEFSRLRKRIPLQEQPL
ncbi:MAG: PQQ-binding-like beta-propeller repeat protein [Rhodopirellula sp.]|nr:PQQ-binding-like beta-propeller repeat protein [Rhodopirellula sp.]